METGRAKIFLQEQRGRHESEWFRSFHMFNFGEYYQEHRQASGDLYILNDDTLAGGRSLRTIAGEDSFLVLVPVTGAIKTTHQSTPSSLIQAGEAQILIVAKGDLIEISNPYETEPVNYLQIGIKRKSDRPSYQSGIAGFDPETDKNKLLSILAPGNSSLPFSCVIGKFTGRSELFHKLKGEKSLVFIYIIEGAFEVQNRLLHAGDGLALGNAGIVEAEALSNDAIVLMVEWADQQPG